MSPFAREIAASGGPASSSEADPLPHASQFSPAEMPATLSAQLRSWTPARVGQLRSGVSLATSELLSFQLAHGRARDAVHASLQPIGVAAALRLVSPELPEIVLLQSAAGNRQIYLQRPDLGRKLNDASRLRLAGLSAAPCGSLSIVLADGLSALAVERHAVPLLAELLPALREESVGFAPICVVEQGRVAIGDEIGNALGAELVLVLIGERPGLSSPDSLGAYLTWRPRPGRTDAERNCVSNIRVEGLSYSEASARLLSYIRAARTLQLTGVALKQSSALLAPSTGEQ